jgi:hypothetical protein
MENQPPFYSRSRLPSVGASTWDCVLYPPRAQNGEYQRHLTWAEVATLQRVDTLEKTQKAFQSIWHDYYDEGPLRVAPTPKGK